MQKQISIFWFRRDLRLHDNAGLYHALRSDHTVVPIFIFDTNILNDLEEKADKRLQFIHHALQNIQQQLQTLGSTLHVLIGKPLDVFKKLQHTYSINAVFTNHDYEPYAIKRDNEINTFLHQHHISFHTFKDQVIFEKNEILKDNGQPYTVYTPYSRRWKEKLNDFYITSYPVEKYFNHFHPCTTTARPITALHAPIHQKSNQSQPSPSNPQ